MIFDYTTANFWKQSQNLFTDHFFWCRNVKIAWRTVVNPCKKHPTMVE